MKRYMTVLVTILIVGVAFANDTEGSAELSALIKELKADPLKKGLDLSHTKVTDLTPLKKLTKLESLDLSNTKVTDLTPLKGLTKLRQLRLVRSQVTDLTPLDDLLKRGRAK